MIFSRPGTMGMAVTSQSAYLNEQNGYDNEISTTRQVGQTRRSVSRREKHDGIWVYLHHTMTTIFGRIANTSQCSPRNRKNTPNETLLLPFRWFIPGGARTNNRTRDQRHGDPIGRAGAVRVRGAPASSSSSSPPSMGGIICTGPGVRAAEQVPPEGVAAPLRVMNRRRIINESRIPHDEYE